MSNRRTINLTLVLVTERQTLTSVLVTEHQTLSLVMVTECQTLTSFLVTEHQTLTSFLIRDLPLITYTPRWKGGGQVFYTFLLHTTCKKGGGGPDTMYNCIHNKWKAPNRTSNPNLGLGNRTSNPDLGLGNRTSNPNLGLGNRMSNPNLGFEVSATLPSRSQWR